MQIRLSQDLGFELVFVVCMNKKNGWGEKVLESEREEKRVESKH